MTDAMRPEDVDPALVEAVAAITYDRHAMRMGYEHIAFADVAKSPANIHLGKWREDARHALAAVIPKVRAEEREACARIAMEYPILETEGTATAHARVMQGLAIAVAIRSRGGAA